MTYQEAKDIILAALTNRPVGTQVQVQNHQNAELAILEYARQIQQSIGSSLFVDFTYFTEEPYIPQTGYSLYIGYIAPSDGSTTTLNYFFDVNGNDYQITTSQNEFVLVFLLWNGTYWDIMPCRVPITRSGEGGGTEVILYSTKGQNTDGAMTQKAATDAINEKEWNLVAGDFVSISRDNNSKETEINAQEQYFNSVFFGQSMPKAGELISANSLVMLGLSDSKLYNITGNTNRSCDPNFGLAFTRVQISSNSSPSDFNLIHQGLLTASVGLLYSTFVEGASYFVGFTENTIDPLTNQTAIKPTGLIYTFQQLIDAKINTYIYIGRGHAISGTNYIQIDLSSHTIITRNEEGAITHINGASTGVTPLTKNNILSALGYEELSDIVLTTSDGKGFSANIIGQRT